MVLDGDRFEVGSTLYRTIPEADGRVNITTHPGRFGAEWVEALVPIPGR